MLLKDNPIHSNISLSQRIILIISGLSCAIIILEIGLRLGGFIFLSLQEYRNRASFKQKGTYRIMCLGESTTAGQYPFFLEDTLNQHNIGIKFSVIDKGWIGTNTPAILNQVESYLDTYHPDMVVAMMGINDGEAHMPYEHPSSSMTLRFLRSFKIYKLSRLLWLHMATKAQEIKFLPSKQSGRSFSTYKPNVLTVGLKGAPIEQTHDVNLEYTLKESLKLNSADDQACLELGWHYHDQGQFSQAKEYFKKALELNPKNDNACLELGRHYHDQGQFSQAKECLEKVLAFNPSSSKLYGALAVIYEATGQVARAQEYYDKANELRLSWYNPITVNNYHTLKEILNRRKIQLVCVQYPMRSIEPLKKIFEDNADGIIFVDNEKSFKEAVSKSSYKAYFNDMFGSDFGHCTPKGNRLLADNIANVILKDVVGK